MTKKIIICTSILASLNGFGAVLAVRNISNTGNELAFANSDSNLLSSGFVGIYTFASGEIPSTAAALKANGTNGILGSIEITAGNSPDAGAFSSQLNFTNNLAGDLYIVIGTGATAADSGDLALINSNLAADGDDTPTPDDLGSYNLVTPEDVLIGSVAPGTVDWTNTGRSAFAANILSLSAAIPEPSSALLLGIGFLAAGARRRR
ncbi:PEP-CTERM sorting domain-containing protein [Akkermansiaceae bacterium]|nr:PEP-CTERM sorting domain-containing protein [Akkermansiaceae bacterium]MDB4318512.1 PEP-CTERM sorting domain-containing protein [bacterium]MDA7649251.1 PEP-CTERM sorting domain-containing protein [Akkermansiaceae bacterium]MDB0055809.1 PEP-CTERM sorting domain-containing protein [Akkermansiaceae bacterium]MDB4312781.1 PEP-CTERM sorting domain-containing protein [Akkermansiaceae bacterium]